MSCVVNLLLTLDSSLSQPFFTGKLISMHRKVHLFDIDIPGKMTFQESLTLTGGDRVTVFDTCECVWEGCLPRPFPHY